MLECEMCLFFYFLFINLSSSLKVNNLTKSVPKKMPKNIFINIAFNHPDCDLEMLQEMKLFFVFSLFLVTQTVFL